MSCGTNGCGCKGGGMFIPFIILGVSVGVIVGALYGDIKMSGTMLDGQIAAQKNQLVGMNAQLQGQQGQQLVAARNHYYGLYSDLVELAKTDTDAAAIATKYGIRITQPANNPSAPPLPPGP